MTMITESIINAAKHGAIKLEALESLDDVALAAKFSDHFREAIRGVDGEALWKSIIAAKAKGIRKYRRECGLWLTEAEFRKGGN